MAANIFISFASKDIKVATTLCSALESRGFSCWISARDIAPGENFQVAIVRALRRCKIMLLVFTANSNTSEEMTKELALASQQKIMVIPLRVEDVAPNEAFAYEFATRQWIDAFADWEVSLDQLSRRIGHALADDADAAQAEIAKASIEAELSAKAEAPKVETPAPVIAEAAKSTKASKIAKEPEPAPPPERPRLRPAREPAKVAELETAGAAAAPGAPARKEGLGRFIMPVALALAVAAAGAFAANSLRRPEPAAPSVAAAAPQIAPAQAVAPAAPEEGLIAPPEDETPKLVKSANPKKAAKSAAPITEDIPF